MSAGPDVTRRLKTFAVSKFRTGFLQTMLLKLAFLGLTVYFLVRHLQNRAAASVATWRRRLATLVVGTTCKAFVVGTLAARYRSFPADNSWWSRIERTFTLVAAVSALVDVVLVFVQGVDSDEVYVTPNVEKRVVRGALVGMVAIQVTLALIGLAQAFSNRESEESTIAMLLSSID